MTVSFAGSASPLVKYGAIFVAIISCQRQHFGMLALGTICARIWSRRSAALGCAHYCGAAQSAIGVLGSLRGACNSLRDLLDNHLTSQLWSAAVGHRLHSQPQEHCQPCADASNADNSDDEHGTAQKGCPRCIQMQLRKVAHGVQRVKVGGRMLRWPRDPIFKLRTRSLHWSPCSRWVAAAIEDPLF